MPLDLRGPPVLLETMATKDHLVNQVFRETLDQTEAQDLVDNQDQ